MASISNIVVPCVLDSCRVQWYHGICSYVGVGAGAGKDLELFMRLS